jgi:hypothetical protein
MHFEILTVKATAPSTGAAGAPNTGDSLTVKNGRGIIQIIGSWATRQVVGFSQLVWPRGHDTTRNWRVSTPIATASLTLPIGMSLRLQPQEVLAPTICGSAVAVDIELDSHLIHYDDFPGISMRSITAEQADARMKNLTTVEASVAAVATGEYSTEAITSDSDLLKANTDYAVLGMSSRTAAHALVLNAPDFGNVRVGCPGFLRPEITSQFFLLMSRAHKKPFVPVFNTGNKAQVNLGFCGDENAAATLITVHLAQL